MAQCRIRIVVSTVPVGSDFLFAVDPTSRGTVRLGVGIGAPGPAVEVSADDAAVMAQMVLRAASKADPNVPYALDHPDPPGSA